MGIYIPNLKRYSLVYKVSDGCTMVAVNLNIVLSNLMWSHDHHTMVAAIIFIRSIVADRRSSQTYYRTMLVRWSCNNLRLSYDLNSFYYLFTIFMYSISFQNTGFGVLQDTSKHFLISESTFVFHLWRGDTLVPLDATKGSPGFFQKE